MCAEYWEWSWVHWNHKQIPHPKCKFLHCFFYVTCTPRELWVVVSVGKWTFTKKICSTRSQRKWINASSHMGRVVVGEQRPRPVDDASCLESISRVVVDEQRTRPVDDASCLEWAVDIIHSSYYIHGPWRAKKNFCCFICVSYGPYTLLQNDSFFTFIFEVFLLNLFCGCILLHKPIYSVAKTNGSHTGILLAV